jgi:hypothetical protein
MIRSSLSQAVFTAAALVIGASAAASNLPQTALAENFDGGAALPGWTKVNPNASAGNGWFTGNAFAAHSGAAGSYVAANFVTDSDANGDFDLWLITPELNLLNTTSLSFFTRTADPDWLDKLEVRYSAGAGTDIASFTKLLTTVDAGAYPTDWQAVTATLVNGYGSGRFAFRYTGNYFSADYIGIDTLAVTTVPEPTTFALLGLGLAGLTVARRKQRRA